MSTCIFGDDPSDDPHHISGRGADGRQLDDDVVVPLCHDHHELIHDDLRLDGLDKPLRMDNPIDQTVRRLRRAAAFLARLADAVPAISSLAYMARGMQRWADQLERFSQTLDRWNPSWRDAGDPS